MKIGVNDNCVRKFSGMIIDHWEKQGHEVRYEMGANPEFGAWADAIFIDFLDNNFLYYYNNKVPKKRLVVRGIDIDMWMGRYRDHGIYTYLDALVVISPYWYQKVKTEMNPPEDKLVLIPPGVDTNKFTLIDREPGYNVCMVTGDFWEMKNFLEGYRIFQMLCKNSDKPWQLHIRGQHNERELEIEAKKWIYSQPAWKDRVFIYGTQDDMNAWYEPMDYIIVPSLKEAFSYATGEAMSKGIKPILNNWLGCSDIWPSKYIYHDLLEAVEMFTNINRNEYRNYILETYPLERMLQDMDKVMGI